MQEAPRNTVILAGSGRSGTTWMGSILNSYEFAEYFYEIDAFPELGFDDADLLKVKYPLTHALPNHPGWMRNLERFVLGKRIAWQIAPERAARSLRVHSQYDFVKRTPDVYLFKIVALFGFVSQVPDLAARFGNHLKVVHIIRNPYSQLASEIRMDSRDPQKSQAHFLDRMRTILADDRFAKYHELVARHMDSGWFAQMALVWWVSNELLEEESRIVKHRVVYEELCRRPYEITRDLFEFLAWPLSQQTLDHIENTTNISSSESESGMFSIKKNAEESINKWRSQIDRETYETISAVLRDCPLLAHWSENDLSLDH